MESASFNNGGDFSVISVQALDCTVVLSEGFSLLRRRGGSRSSRRPAEMAFKPADHIGDHLLGHLVLHTGVRHHLQFRSLASVSHTQDARHTRQHTRDTGHGTHRTRDTHKTQDNTNATQHNTHAHADQLLSAGSHIECLSSHTNGRRRLGSSNYRVEARRHVVHCERRGALRSQQQRNHN
jgi:hypothetical protein